MKFVTDSTELAGADTPDANEQSKAPGGIIGFSLEFFQTTTGCN